MEWSTDVVISNVNFSVLCVLKAKGIAKTKNNGSDVVYIVTGLNCFVMEAVW